MIAAAAKTLICIACPRVRPAKIIHASPLDELPSFIPCASVSQAANERNSTSRFAGRFPAQSVQIGTAVVRSFAHSGHRKMTVIQPWQWRVLLSAWHFGQKGRTLSGRESSNRKRDRHGQRRAKE
jgi:hypothetical protein